ncbi:DUF4097 family beta strand repeat-containing protein [Actinomadura sp. DC4]|uniref:DUF4097 family beta strand repeat-containing protein n=1 Tax=Actinomadura sp. DC4 TaxID=3055069 RepID=UPI0025B05D6E|nr:DUF4097 family beta strand repeat-containing protein [Actinomadura sp. DC4]MDN3354964.1 DUF4097 family beta strand repeat-containing protein [Actinomadura sp. DC4]
MRKFDTPTPITTVVNVPAGRVRFIAADRPDTTIEVLPADASKGRDVKAAERTEVTYTDGVLRITVPAKTTHLGSSGSVEVTVQLPAGSHVQATAAATELRGVGRLGDVTFEGAYRQIKLDETTSAHLTATDADIEIGHLNGPAQITTARGHIRITEAAHGTLALRTRSGDISVGAASGVSASLDASTGHGRVTNALKNNGTTELDIHATTSHGDIAARSL